MESEDKIFFVSLTPRRDRLDKATARLKSVLSRVRVADLQKSKGDPKPTANQAASAASVVPSTSQPATRSFKKERHSRIGIEMRSIEIVLFFV